MATRSVIDPEWKFKVDQVTRILEKVGATSVSIWKHPPEMPNGYILVAHHNDKIWQVAGENLPDITKTLRFKLSKKGEK